MSLAWMALVAGLMAFEKLIPSRRAATYGTTAVLLVLGVLLMLAPDGIAAPTCPGTARCHRWTRCEFERLGCLERRPDPDDLRSKRIALTPRGIAAVTVIRQAVAEVETFWEQQLGPKRFAQLRNLLHELNALA